MTARSRGIEERDEKPRIVSVRHRFLRGRTRRVEILFTKGYLPAEQGYESGKQQQSRRCLCIADLSAAKACAIAS